MDSTSCDSQLEEILEFHIYTSTKLLLSKDKFSLPPVVGFFNWYRVISRFSQHINVSTAPISNACKVSFTPYTYFPESCNWDRHFKCDIHFNSRCLKQLESKDMVNNSFSNTSSDHIYNSCPVVDLSSVRRYAEISLNAIFGAFDIGNIFL